MEKKIYFIIAILFLLNSLSCNTTEPEKTKLEISAEDASCKEAWIRVTGETGGEFILHRDDIDPVSVPLETYFYSIRGSGLNNIVAVGEGSYIAHFNGVNWKVYD